MKKSPIMMSALVCPGLGQMMQGRKAAGASYLGLILVSLASIMLFFFRILIAFYRLGLEFRDPGSMVGDYVGFGVSFAITLLIYIVNVADVIKGEQRPPPISSPVA